jgi:excisionase family DNA binding protein
VLKNLIDPKGLSEYLKISIETVYAWTSQKRIPYIKVGRLVRFDLDEIAKWLEKNKRSELKY